MTAAPSADILVVLRAAVPNLAPAERRVADAVLADPAGSAMQTISRLARTCTVSETTVIRFCRTIGLRGYPELRLALAAAVSPTGGGGRYLAGDIDDDDDLSTIVKKIGYADARAVEDTTENLDVAVLARVVDLMASARRIDIYGVGASGYVALDLQHKLQRIGRLGLAWPDPHMALTSAALLGPDDVAFGLSHTGTTIDTIQALQIARAAGASTVALTNFPHSPIVGGRRPRAAHRRPRDDVPLRGRWRVGSPSSQ